MLNNLCSGEFLVITSVHKVTCGAFVAKNYPLLPLPTSARAVLCCALHRSIPPPRSGGAAAHALPFVRSVVDPGSGGECRASAWFLGATADPRRAAAPTKSAGVSALTDAMWRLHSVSSVHRVHRWASAITHDTHTRSGSVRPPPLPVSTRSG